MTIIDEKKDFFAYNRMTLVEFFEFLGRWSQALFPLKTQPLNFKIERLLELLIPIVGQEFKSLIGEDNVSSESDYDDDAIDDIFQELTKKKTFYRRAV